MTSGSAVAPVPSAGQLTYNPRIMASRRQIDNRFPTLGFNVDTGGHAFYEVLLATDSQLFDPAKAGMRTPANFYSSRQSGGLMSAAESVHPYFVPSAVLHGFGQAVPRPNSIFYTVIAYDDKDGANPSFAQPPASLSTTTPHEWHLRDFTGATLATVLAVSVDKLQRVGTAHGFHRPYAPGERRRRGGRRLRGAAGFRGPARSRASRNPARCRSAATGTRPGRGGVRPPGERLPPRRASQGLYAGRRALRGGPAA